MKDLPDSIHQRGVFVKPQGRGLGPMDDADKFIEAELGREDPRDGVLRFLYACLRGFRRGGDLSVQPIQVPFLIYHNPMFMR